MSTRFRASVPNGAMSSPSPDTGIIRAIVVARGAETEYLHAGQGEPVIVLAEPGAKGLATALTRSLTSRHRVIVPQARRGAGPLWERLECPALSTWLQDFIDGLGLPNVSLVAVGRCALPALSFAMGDSERVRRLALLFHEGADPLAEEPGATDLLARSGHPLLVLGLPAGPGAAAASEVATLELRRFLAAERDTSSGGDAGRG